MVVECYDGESIINSEWGIEVFVLPYLFNVFMCLLSNDSEHLA